LPDPAEHSRSVLQLVIDPLGQRVKTLRLLAEFLYPA
jgi:hypothetical protein